MPTPCVQCGVQMPDDSTFCPGCGRAVSGAAPVLGKTGGIRDNIAGMLAYVTLVPAVVFLLVEPFNKNRFIRFHAFQCIFLAVAIVVIGIALKLVFLILSLIPVLGHLVVLLLLMIFSVGLFILWILLLVKAFQGENFKLPVIGNLAEKQANIV